MLTMAIVPIEKVRQKSGFTPAINRVVETLKTNNFYLDTRPISGEAPKCFLYVYEFRNGNCRKANKNTWIPYIAKFGHKWYPNESVTEYLFNRIGETLNINMAKSRLAVINGQLRFLSRYFLLNNEEILVHGAEIFSQWLEDKAFVSEIERKKLEQDFFTFQSVEHALNKAFPQYGQVFLDSFVRLLILDALLGNNDRHHYNWAIIIHLKGTYPPRFSPIYDTARGLFWSTPEQNIKTWLSNQKQLTLQLEKYAEGAKPLTGWDDHSNINHFQLIELICQDGRFKDVLKELIQLSHLDEIYRVIDTEFLFLMSPNRRHLIKTYLHLRFQRIYTIVTNY